VSSWPGEQQLLEGGQPHHPTAFWAGGARNTSMSSEGEGAVDAGAQRREGDAEQKHAAVAPAAAWLGRRMRVTALFLLLCVALLPVVQAGTFISGSVRWEKVKDNTARFDVVTYWRRSFSPFMDGNAKPGDKIDIIAQSTVSLNFGDRSAPHFLLATVTNINEDEDWLEAVTTYEHTYATPYAKKELVAAYSDATSDAPVTEQQFRADYTPWVVTLAGCCRYATITNDPDKPFLMRSHVNLESSARSPDARLLPTISVKPHSNFKASVTAPLYQPQSMINNTQALRFSWCPSSSWTNPGTAKVQLNPVTGMVTWKGTTSSVWYHLCVQGSIDSVMSEVDFMVYVSCPPLPSLLLSL